MDPAAEAAPPSPGAQAPQTSALRLSLLRLVPALGIGAATFIPAGTLRWPGGWLGVVLVGGASSGRTCTYDGATRGSWSAAPAPASARPAGTGR